MKRLLLLIAGAVVLGVALQLPPAQRSREARRPQGEVSGQAAAGVGTPGVIPSPLPSVAADFESLLQRVEAALPREGDLAAIEDEELHAAPRPVTVAAVALGEVAQAVADDPSLQPRALTFYRDCAEGRRPQLIRAFCLARARTMTSDEGDLAWSEPLPEAVKELSRQARFN